MSHGQAGQRVLGVAELAARGLEEFEPGRRGEEQVAHFDPGAAALGRRLQRRLAAAFHGQAPGLFGAPDPAGDAEPTDRSDGGQGLAPESQGGDVDQVVVRQLGGGVTLDRQLQLPAVHAGAVVGHRDQGPAAVAQHRVHLAQHRVHLARAGVDGVLDQFLQDRGRTLDHLAGGDLID
jgi:hypothetical protein